MLNNAARQVIESGALAHLVTVNEDGSPQLAVVWVGLDGDELVSAHLGSAAEAAQHPQGPSCGALLRGRGRQRHRDAQLPRGPWPGPDHRRRRTRAVEPSGADVCGARDDVPSHAEPATGFRRPHHDRTRWWHGALVRTGPPSTGADDDVKCEPRPAPRTVSGCSQTTTNPQWQGRTRGPSGSTPDDAPLDIRAYRRLTSSSACASWQRPTSCRPSIRTLWRSGERPRESTRASKNHGVRSGARRCWPTIAR